METRSGDRRLTSVLWAAQQGAQVGGPRKWESVWCCLNRVKLATSSSHDSLIPGILVAHYLQEASTPCLALGGELVYTAREEGAVMLAKLGNTCESGSQALGPLRRRG